MYSNGYITVNGKTYFFERINTLDFINGMPIKDWMDTLDQQSHNDLYELGIGIIQKTIKDNFQEVINDFHKTRNN